MPDARVLRVLFTILVVLVSAPMACVEGVTQAGLRAAGGAPQLPDVAHVARLHRAVWAAYENGPQRVEPSTAWSMVWSVLSAALGRRPWRQRPSSPPSAGGRSQADVSPRRPHGDTARPRESARRPL